MAAHVSFDAESLFAEPDRSEAAPLSAEGAEEIEVLTFGAGGELYGLALTEVSEVAKVPPVTPVPGLPPALLGAVNLRGEVIAVADLQVLLGVGAVAPGPLSRLVIIRLPAERVGLLVDLIGDLERGVPSERPPGAGELVARQVILRDGRLVACLDLAKVIDALVRG